MDIQHLSTFTHSPQLPISKAASQAGVPEQPGDSLEIGGRDGAQAPAKKWTIMHFSAADNNLMSYLVTDVNEMEKVGSTEHMNVVVQLDKGGSDCKRFYLNKDDNMSAINSPVIKDLGKTNMADPEVLAAFIAETMKEYPAEHYALIISDHGNGWKGAVEDSGSHGWMSLPDIRKGIERGEEMAGRRIDVLGFDACLMATSEVAYEMKDVAGYLVASEQTEGANGWPYTPLLTPRSLENIERALRSKLNINPDEFAKKIIDTAQGDQGTLPTLSAIDLAMADQLAAAANTLADAIMATGTPPNVLQDIAKKTQSFYGYKDQYHFAEQIAQSTAIADEELKKAAQGMMDAIKTAVVAEQHAAKFPNAHGLTAEIPSYGGVGGGYEKLHYRKDTRWAEAMNTMNNAGSPAPYPQEPPPEQGSR